MTLAEFKQLYKEPFIAEWKTQSFLERLENDIKFSRTIDVIKSFKRFRIWCFSSSLKTKKIEATCIKASTLSIDEIKKQYEINQNIPYTKINKSIDKIKRIEKDF